MLVDMVSARGKTIETVKLEQRIAELENAASAVAPQLVPKPRRAGRSDYSATVRVRCEDLHGGLWHAHVRMLREDNEVLVNDLTARPQRQEDAEFGGRGLNALSATEAHGADTNPDTTTLCGPALDARSLQDHLSFVNRRHYCEQPRVTLDRLLHGAQRQLIFVAVSDRAQEDPLHAIVLVAGG
ncbi:MAG: hypothetical protein U1E73_05270 [Planctomycetota bacterium]